MSGTMRKSEMVRSGDVAIEAYVDGAGDAFVILPSYGRDGGVDYDGITSQLTSDKWHVIRPQPRGIAGSLGPMEGLSLHNLASDVAMCIRVLAKGPAVLLGHAFGNILARVVTTDYPDLVRAVILASAEASKVPEDIAKTPMIAGDLTASRANRLAALRKAFFAPDHDASVWLEGWYPATLKMQHAAAQKTGLRESWACGNVPLLQIIAEQDPFIPKAFWNEMQDEFGTRVTVSHIGNASHALFPEQPALVADAILPWAAKYRP